MTYVTKHIVKNLPKVRLHVLDIPFVIRVILTSVATRLGYPGHSGHILSGSSRSHPLYKYPGLTVQLEYFDCSVK